MRFKKEIILSIGIALGLLVFVTNPFALAAKSNVVLSIATLMITWWVSEALPLPVVALLPIVLFPICGVAPIKEVTKSYSDSVVFLFMGGFFIGIAIEKWNLHRRIALNIIKKTGTNGNKIILGFIIATGFLSMWLSNTATTMMMFPIALSVIEVIQKHNDDEKSMKHFSLVVMMVLAYASNFAVGTIIGTPPNVAYAGYVQDKFDYTLGFGSWMLVFTPLTIALMASLYWVMTKWLYPNKIKYSATGKAFIEGELQKLGPLTVPEKRVLWIFGATVCFWIFKDLINAAQTLIQLDDTIIALLGAISLFLVRSGKDGEALLVWKDTTKMAWGILVLFGGGIALAKGLEDAGLLQQLGNYIASFSSSNTFIMILVITTLSVFLSELMGNVAQVIVMAPVVTSIALALHMDPLLLGIPMTLGASCASMLPMGTPPNAIVFASGHIKMKHMLVSGFVLNIICIILITLFCWLLQPLLMSIS